MSISGVRPSQKNSGNVFHNGLYVEKGPVVFPKKSLQMESLDINFPNGGVVGVSTDETITGIKTFTYTPKSDVVPVNPDDLVNKAYIDNFPSGKTSIGDTNIWQSANTFNTILPKSSLLATDGDDFMTMNSVLSESIGFARTQLGNTNHFENQNQFDNPIECLSDPIEDSHLVRKDYVDSIPSGKTTLGVTNVWQSANTFNTVLPQSNILATNGFDFMTMNSVLAGSLGLAKTKGSINSFSNQNKFELAVECYAAPIGPLHLTRKDYVDSIPSGKTTYGVTNFWQSLNRYDTLLPTSQLLPTDVNQFTTKGYVDSKIMDEMVPIAFKGTFTTEEPFTFTSGIQTYNSFTNEVTPSLISVIFPNFVDAANLTELDFKKVQSISGLSSFTCNSMTKIIGNYVTEILPSLKVESSSLTHLLFPEIKMGPDMALGAANVNTIDFSKMESCAGGISIRENKLTQFAFPELVITGHFRMRGGGGGGSHFLTLIDCPKLTTVLDSFEIEYGTYSTVEPTLNFPMLTSVGGQMKISLGSTVTQMVTFPELNNVSMIQMFGHVKGGYSCPKLVTVGELNGFIAQERTFETFNFPLLTTVTVRLGLADVTLPLTQSFPSMITMHKMNLLRIKVMKTLDFPLLQELHSGNECSLSSCPSIETLNFPNIVKISAIGIVNNPSLKTITLGNNLRNVLGNVQMHNNALLQSTVDHILERLASLDGTNGTTLFQNRTVSLQGGTNATPSATGLLSRDILIARNCTVTVNV